jgi:hypothetical protein
VLDQCAGAAELDVVGMRADRKDAIHEWSPRRER